MHNDCATPYLDSFDHMSILIYIVHHVHTLLLGYIRILLHTCTAEHCAYCITYVEKYTVMCTHW